MKSTEVVGLAVWVAVCFVAAAVGGMASMSAPRFYAQLARPSWAPPGSVFGPVWTVLYLLMAVAAWLVWRERGWTGARVALTLFVAQLCVNALWTWLFFAWRSGVAALVDIVLLLVLIAATVAAFFAVRPVAAALLVPYFAWVAFATALTAAVWRRNPGVL